MNRDRFHSPFYSFAALCYVPPSVEEITEASKIMLPDYEPTWSPSMGPISLGFHHQLGFQFNGLTLAEHNLESLLSLVSLSCFLVSFLHTCKFTPIQGLGVILVYQKSLKPLRSFSWLLLGG